MAAADAPPACGPGILPAAAWQDSYDFEKHEEFLNLGQTDSQDFDEGRSPMEV